MRQIVRYKIPIQPVTQVAVHEAAKAEVLYAEIRDHGAVDLYMLVDELDFSLDAMDWGKYTRRDIKQFHLFETGNHVPGDLKYLATVNDGPMVWHIFHD